MAVLAVAVSPAFASETHLYTGTSFGPDGIAGGEKFQEINGVAVNQASGDVFVYDGSGRIYKFDSAGEPLDFSALGTNVIEEVGTRPGRSGELAIAPAGAVGGTAGDIYAANGNVIRIYAASGALLGQIERAGETCGVATDSSGHIFSRDGLGGGLYEYTPSANPPVVSDQTRAIGLAPSELCNVAVDGLGNVYAGNPEEKLVRFEGLGDGTPDVVVAGAKTLAVDPVGNDLYADRLSEVIQFDSSGAQLGSFGSDRLANSRGIAVNGASGKIYVGHGGEVDVFGAAVLAPDAATDAATEVSKTSALLHGTIGAAGGPAATCQFEYVAEEHFNSEGFAGADTAPCAPAGPFTGSGNQTVSAAPGGLSAGTTIRFRLKGSNEDAYSVGQVLSFATLDPVNVAIGKATNLSTDGATLNGTIDPEGEAVEECFFEYGGGSSFGQIAPCAESSGEIGTGSGPVDVHADVSGLEASTAYQFHLVAANSLGQSKSKSESFLTRGPKVTEVFVSAVAPDGATLHGTVSPNGEDTTYSFQYVSEAEFAAGEWANAAEVPAGGGSVEASQGTTEVAATISGLTPRTTYHYRLLAQNLSGFAISPGRIFTTFADGEVGGLPDGRAYEQATPVDKNGNSVQGAVNMVQAASAGARITYYVGGGVPGGVGGTDLPTFMSSRQGDAWTTRGLLPPAATGPRGAVKGWSEDLLHVYSINFQFNSSPTKGNLYESNSDSGAVRTLASGLSTLRPYYAGSSGDGSIVAFEEAETGEPSVYVWDEATNQTTLATVFNDGTSPEEGAAAGPFDWYESNTIRAGAAGAYYVQAEHALSVDGSRLYFTAMSSQQLYLRKNPTAQQSPLGGGGECTDQAAACTVEVSASQASTPDPNGKRPAIFSGATPDGSSVFFMSRGKLTDDANTGPEDEGQDLYRYDADSKALTDLTADSTDPVGAKVFGVLGYSNDGSHVYFLANGDLAPGAPQGTCGGAGPSVDGTCNVYEWDNGAVKFIAQLSMGGSQGGDQANIQPTSTGPEEIARTGQVSADGNVLLFSSVKQQTSFDNEGFRELYRFDSRTDELDCVSCNSTQSPPAGNASATAQIPPNLTPLGKAGVQKRNLSASGDRVFFDTADKLLAADTNGVNDVYEWEADGSGSCDRGGQGGGCLYLISSGTGVHPSYFGDANESGDDVFFFTSQPLVGQDRDELIDVYDARVGGGIASQNPPASNSCLGEACRGPVPAAPASGTAGTTTFSGPPDPKPSRKHKKKHHKKKQHKKKHHKGAGKNRAAQRQEGSHR